MPFRTLVLSLLLLAAACRSTNENAYPLVSDQSIEPGDYRRVLAEWTRSYEIYDVLHSIAFMHATFHSPEFRRAFLIRHTDVYGAGSEEASRLLLTKPEAEQFHEFFFSVSTSNQAWNDFDRDDSIWRFTLASDTGASVDGVVERVKTTANIRVIYPYITGYASTYAVRFPLVAFTGDPIITKKTRQLTLFVTSALGRAELTWRIAPLKAGAQAAR